ncbi:hypothetical protein IC235_06500 [Hymenobacter sp. BT664]|uniref:Uncharacterized protein n=1 Tax=Hymenobacter montanus TaxID=2771359 RepID=A0A927BCF3_9BACT|nr:hypothetical protein [Hymenobacter montanus]MBD2767538.1 hypothetical protein [Hymenobacter montanus]
MNKTLESFLQEVVGAVKIKEKILQNMKTNAENDIILNLFDLEFDFKTRIVTIKLLY